MVAAHAYRTIDGILKELHAYHHVHSIHSQMDLEIVFVLMDIHYLLMV
jgi:hypothetical protein